MARQKKVKRKNSDEMGCGTLFLWVIGFPFMLLFYTVRLLSEAFSILRDPNSYGAPKKAKRPRGKVPKLSFKRYDRLSGIRFYRLCEDMLAKNGFTDVRLVNSKKRIVHIIAEGNGMTYAFYCKRQRKRVGKKAVSKAVLGRDEHKCEIGVVLTNSYFKGGAEKRAKAAGIILWGRPELTTLSKYAELLQDSKDS